MPKEKTCYECSEYINIFNKNNQIAQTGLCTLVDGSEFHVSKNRTSCIFGNCGKKLNVKQIKERDKRAREDNKHFTDYLKAASKEVQTWPIWKQTALRI